jgi:WD40 repeat protein
MLLGVALVATALWGILYAPDAWRDLQDWRARDRIDAYELNLVAGGKGTALPELVAILGDSRLKHWNRVFAVSFLSRSTLVSYGGDGAARFWDADSGRQLRWLEGSRGFAASRDGSRVFLGEENGTVRVCDAKTLTIIGNLRVPSQNACLAVSSDGDVLACGAIGSPGDVQVWNVESRRLRGTIYADVHGLACLGLNSDGSLVAIGGGGVVEVWDTSALERLHHLGPFTGADGGSGKGVVWTVAFSPDGSTLVTGDATMRLRQWDVASGAEKVELPEHNGSVRDIAFGRNSSQLATVSANTVRVIESNTGKVRRELNAPHEGAANAAAMNGTELATAGSDHAVKIWLNGQAKRLTGGPTWDVTCVAFNHNGDQLATGSSDGTIRIWNTGIWQLLTSWKAHTSWIRRVAFSSSGPLASSSDDGTVVIWNPATGEEQHTLSKFSHHGSPLAFSPDGTLLATKGTRLGSRIVQLWDVSTGKPIRTLQLGKLGLRGEIRFSCDGTRLARGDYLQSVTVWDVQTATLIAGIGEKTARDVPVAFSPDGEWVASCGKDNTVKVWSVATGDEMLSLAGHSGQVSSICVNSDGSLIASAAWDGTVRIWSVSFGRELKLFRLAPRGAAIYEVVFSPNDQYLATANGNGTAYILRVPARRLLAAGAAH